MKITTLICDCGCKEEIEKKNPFVLSKKEIPGPTGRDFDDLKLRGDLHFLDLDHLFLWVNKAVKTAPILKKLVKEEPQFRGFTNEQDTPELYI